MVARIRFAGFAASALALAALSAPVEAQFGGIFGRSSRSSSSDRDSSGCPKGKSRSAESQIASGILGSIAGSAAGSVGGIVAYVPVAAFTDVISASIACKLDPKEQEQAANATLEATRGPDEAAEAEVGSMAEWTSNTREDVSGTSTVVARDDAAADGRQCITVSDVVIVKGEETRADKRMCRTPPAVRYAIVA
jgi:surface antigen